jgi:hypothetical protein
MEARPCNASPNTAPNDRRHECVFSMLLPTLDTVQRHAYEEIRSKVYMATGPKLPIELTKWIFQLTLAAEDVPCDPRLIIPAVHKDDKDVARHGETFRNVRKALMTTSIHQHSIQDGVGRCKTGRIPGYYSSEYPTLKYWPQWVASRVKLARNDDERHWSENKECAYYISETSLSEFKYHYDSSDADEADSYRAFEAGVCGLA